MNEDNRPTSRSIARRLWWPRTVGMGLGGILVSTTLWQQGRNAELAGPVLLFALVWPPLAFLISRRSATARRTERRLLLVDAFVGGLCVPAMSFNPLTSGIVLAMTGMNNAAFGGARMLCQGLASQLAGIVGALALVGWSYHDALTLQTALTCLPFLFVYPATIGLTAYTLSRKLNSTRKMLIESQALYTHSLQALDVGVVLWGADGRLLLCNDEFRRHYRALGLAFTPGFDYETMLRAAVRHGLVPEAIGNEDEWVAKRLETLESPGYSMTRRLPDGRCLRLTEKRLPDGRLLAYSMDLTQLRTAMVELRSARASQTQALNLLEDAIRSLPDGFALFDPDDRLILCNESYAPSLFGRPVALEKGMTYEEVLRAAVAQNRFPEAAGDEEAFIARQLQLHRSSPRAVLQQLAEDRWFLVNDRRTRDGGFAGVRTDVTDLVRREHELRRLYVERDSHVRELRRLNSTLAEASYTDSMTGLANHRKLAQRMQEEWQRARRHHIPLSVLMIDVDHFKRYNDRYGHQAGDRCLVAVASVLREVAKRATDLPARYGGEEFVVILPHTTAAVAKAVANRLCDLVQRQEVVHEDSPLKKLTVSVGVAGTDILRELEGPDDLLKRADEALYRAKSEGRNRAQLATASNQPPPATDWTALDARGDPA